MITGGLKKLGLDPTQIKYVILTHIHSDRIWGSPYIQKTYGAHVIMSQADWDALEKVNDPAELKANNRASLAEVIFSLASGQSFAL